MRRVSSIALLFLLSTSYAGDMMPNINDMPILQAILGETDANREACKRGQELLLGQIGVTSRYNLVKTYVNNETNAVTNGIVQRVSHTEYYTDLSKYRTLFFIVGTGYTVARTHEITQTFKDPWYPKLQHDLTVNFDGRVATTLRLPF